MRPDAGRILLNGHGPRRPAAASPAGEHDVPVLRSVPAYERRRQHRLRPAPARRDPRRDGGSGRARCSIWCSLTGFGERRPSQLSGGQQQRVALARAARAAAPNCCCSTSRFPRSTAICAKQTRDELVRRAAATRHHLHPGHARPGGGDDYGHPHRRDAATGGWRRSAPRPRSTSGRLADSSPSSSARPTCCPPSCGTRARTGRSWSSRRRRGAGSRHSHAHGRAGAGGAAPGAPAHRSHGDSDERNRLSGVVADSAYWGEMLMHTVRLADGSLLRVSEPLARRCGPRSVTPGAGVTVCWPPEACILLPR